MGGHVKHCVEYLEAAKRNPEGHAKMVAAHKKKEAAALEAWKRDLRRREEEELEMLQKESEERAKKASRAREEARQWRANGRGVVSLLKSRSYYDDVQRFVGKMEEGMARKGGVAQRQLNVLAARLPDEALEVLCHAATKGAPKGIGETAFILFPLGGKIARPAEGG